MIKHTPPGDLECWLIDYRAREAEDVGNSSTIMRDRKQPPMVCSTDGDWEKPSSNKRTGRKE